MRNFKPVVIIPSYNTGATLLVRTVSEALAQGTDVLVVIDGSTDGSPRALEALACPEPCRLRVLEKPHNSGKGDSLLQAAGAAIREGYTHALMMDSDGQHPAAAIPLFLDAAKNNPDCLIMGQPVFGRDAPAARLYGRRLTSFWTDIESAWCGLGDTLFGMRVYPLREFVAAFGQTRFARGFDFDPEIAVRMVWGGCRPLQVPVKVRYLRPEEGGVSHFHYLRDNVKLTFLHFRLVPEFILFRLIPLLKHTRKWKRLS